MDKREAIALAEKLAQAVVCNIQIEDVAPIDAAEYPTTKHYEGFVTGDKVFANGSHIQLNLLPF